MRFHDKIHLIHSPEKFAWVSPQISLLDLQRSEGKFPSDQLKQISARELQPVLLAEIIRQGEYDYMYL